ncbi:MAG: helix-turn-helix domain-containing protein [Eubacteriales bacterium]|nr:helix-turn-helix domain-containing protein [Eubacteriales bacterium]
MLSENLKALRRQRGLSQQELADRLNVVRQTVSKWEKGLSVPDAQLLMKLAEILNVPVADLLGGPVTSAENENEVASQLARINEQLAAKNHRSRLIWKVVAWIAAIFLIFNTLMVLLAALSSHLYTTRTTVEQITFSEESQVYEIK